MACITKAPCRGEVTGRSPVEPGQTRHETLAVLDGTGIPLHLVAARANDHDSPLREPALAAIVDMIGPLPQYRDLHGDDEFPNVHLDRGYDSGKTRDLLDILGFSPELDEVTAGDALVGHGSIVSGAPWRLITVHRRRSPPPRCRRQPAVAGHSAVRKTVTR